MSNVDSLSRERLARRLLAVMLAEAQGEDQSDEDFSALLETPISDFWLTLANDVKAHVASALPE